MASIEGYRPDIAATSAFDSHGSQWANESLRSTLIFLTVLAGFALGVIGLDVSIPKWGLYGFAVIVGSIVFVRSLYNAEWLLAIVPLYIPLSKQFVVPIAPGINGTNVLLFMLMVSWISRSIREERPLFKRMPYTRLTAVWGLLSCFSAVTLTLNPGGLDYLLEDVYFDFKAWIDQFILFFAFVNLIRDGAMARRIVLYMMLGTLVTMVMGLQEMLNKLGLNSIEKSRLLGPQHQPNDFGAFLVYSAAPFIGVFLTSIGNLRSWVLIPYFAAMTKLLIMTFSRGAYLGFAAAITMAAYVRGKWFLLLAAMLLAATVSMFPELIPESLLDRMSHTQIEKNRVGDQLDKSTESRFVLWNAAIDMSLEDPFFGKGFAMFPVLKGRYTERSVVESDTHNMYLFISSQMGIPALIAFILILFAVFKLGAQVFRGSEDRFAKAIGVGGAALAAGTVVVNMFGSRMVNTEVSGYFWIYLAVLVHLFLEQKGETKLGEDER